MDSLNADQPAEPKPQRRRAFRLRIPAGERLIATIEGTDHVVLEVSEYGLVVDAVEVPNCDGCCKGVIHWDSRNQSAFEGTMGAHAKGGRVIEILDGISMRDMVRQQRRLMSRYPSVRLWSDS